MCTCSQFVRKNVWKLKIAMSLLPKPRAANHILCTLKIQLWSLSLSLAHSFFLFQSSFSSMNKTSYTKPPQNSNMRAPTPSHTHIYVKWHLLARWMKRWIRCIHISEARTNHVSSPPHLNTIRGVKRLHRKCQTVRALRIDCDTNLRDF